ncbi:MAG: hypothetical protein QOH05_514 [Acetobacteraceae bacterium]|jgi:hypothetical protein|nr:hypothetical protein [Acetobacteraceae bacterium]
MPKPVKTRGAALAEAMLAPGLGGAEAGDETDVAVDATAGGTIFVPPWTTIIRRDSEADAADADVVVPQKLLRFLLRCLLDQADFDERQYRTCNPDVAEAIKQKMCVSGRDHFIRTGYFEGRSGGTPVQETWYLARNPDVAAAKQSGKIATGEAQYRLAGAHEWREPNPESVRWIAAWKDVLGNS